MYILRGSPRASTAHLFPVGNRKGAMPLFALYGDILARPCKKINLFLCKEMTNFARHFLQFHAFRQTRLAASRRRRIYLAKRPLCAMLKRPKTEGAERQRA